MAETVATVRQSVISRRVRWCAGRSFIFSLLLGTSSLLAAAQQQPQQPPQQPSQQSTATEHVDEPASSLLAPWGQPLAHFASAADSANVYSAPAYARYTEVGQCLAATLRRTNHYWRDKREDTLVYDPLHTQQLSQVRDSARVCASRLPKNQVLSTDALVPALKLALFIGDTNRIMDVTRTIRARIRKIPALVAGQLLRNVVQSYLDANPAYPDSALAYARLLDSLGPAAAREQLPSYGVIANFGYTIDRMALADTAAKRAMGFMRESKMSTDDRLDWADLLLETYFTNSLVAAVEHALSRDSAPPQRYLDSALARFEADLPRANQGAIRSKVLEWQTGYHVLGRMAPPIRGQYWFNTGGDTASFPRRGVVTLVYASRMPGGEKQYPTFSVLRRLGKRFAGQPFQIVLLSFTSGVVYNHLVPDEDEEAKAISKYFLDFLKLPATVAIERARFSTMASGLRHMAPLVNQRFYPMGVYGFDAAVIGKDGRVVFLASLNAQTERVVTDVVEAALKTPTGASK